MNIHIYMNVCGDDGIDSKDQEMTKRWKNFMISEKSRNVVGGEQQQHNVQR